MKSTMSFDTMSNSFITASAVGLNIGKMPVGHLSGSMLASHGGTPLQPVLPAKRSYRPTGSEHEITDGLQCPGEQSQKDLVH